jgi:hypothetical protein
MGTGYTRNDTANNIADGNVINAADFDGEYDAIESAFNATSGHTHDGTAGEGAPVSVLGPVQDFVASSTEVKPKTDNTLDIGTSALQFKDMYLNGKAYIDGLGETLLVDTDKAIQFRDSALSINSSTDGQLDIDADTELELVAPTVDIDASTAVTIDTATLTITGAANITGDLDVDNININNNTIISTDTNGNIALTPNGTGEVDISKVDIDSGTIDGVTIGGSSAAAGTFTAIDVDNININGNTISSTDSNGDITLDPNGTGVIDVPSTTKLQIRDSAIFINSSTDGQLDIDADAEVEITAPIVDIDASTSVNISNDLKLDSDAAVVSLGADGEVTLTHEHNVGVTLNVENSGTNSVTDILKLQAQSSGTPAIGIGTGIEFSTETAAGNLETGGVIESVTTGINPTSEEFDMLFKTMSSGGAAAERLKLNGSGATIGNINVDGNTIISTDTNGNIALTPNGTGEVDISKVDIDAGAIDGVTIGTNSAVTELQVDNINVNGNAITSTDTNGNIALTPNGTGEVDISKVDIASGEIDGVTIGTNSAVTDLRVDNIKIDGNTISSTDTNGNITIDPNGTGDVLIGTLKFDADQTVGSSQDNMVLTYDDSGGTIQLEAIPAPSIGGNLSSALTTNGNNIELGDSGGATDDRIRFGDGDDISIYWDGTDGHITALGTLNIDGADGHEMAKFVDGGAVELYHNDTKTFETTTTGVTVTGRALSSDGSSAITTDSPSSNVITFDLEDNNNFQATTTGDDELTFSNTVAGQSGNIFLTAGGGTISANAMVAINADALTALSTAGVYHLAYFVKAASGDNRVLVSVSGALT